MQKDWSQIFPIQEISDNCLVNGNGDISIGYKVSLPDAYTLSAKDKNSVYEEFTSLLRLLPIGAKLHKQDFFYLDQYYKESNGEETLSIYKNKVHFDEKPIIKNHSHIYITFSNPKIIKNTGHFIFKRPFKNVEIHIEKTKNSIKQIEGILKGFSKVKFERLKESDLIKNLEDYFNLTYGNITNNENETPNFLNEIQLEKDYFKNGSDIVNVISLIEEGDNIIDYKKPKIASGEVYENGIDLDNTINLESSFLFPLSIGLPFNHIINTFISIEDTSKVERELNTKNTLSNPIRSFSLAAQEQGEFIMSYKKHLVTNNVVPTKVGMNIIIHDKDINELSKQEGFITTTLVNINNAKSVTENYNTFSAFMYSSPGNVRNFKHSFISDNQRAVHFLNIEQHVESDKSGYLFLDRVGNPKIVNFRNSKLAEAFNGVIFGPTGMGKSYLIHNFLDNAISSNEDIFLINTKNDYYKYALFLKELGYDVNYIDTNKEKIGIDLFLMKQDHRGNYLYDDDHIFMIKDILLLAWKNDEDALEIEKSILEELILSYYELSNSQKQRPTFEGFIKYIPIFQKTISKNEKYFDTSGIAYFDFNNFLIIVEKYSSIFNEQNQVDIYKAKATFFDLSGVMTDSKIFKIYLNYTFSLGTNKIKINQEKQRYTHVLVDECVDSMVGKGAEIIGRAYRTYRSKNAGIWIATQGITYLDDLPEMVKASIFSNAMIKILLDHSKTTKDLPTLKTNLSMSDFGIDLLMSITSDKSKPYREFYLQIGNSERVYRNQVSPFTNLLFNTRPDIVNKIMNYYSELGSIKASINKYLEYDEK